MDDPLVLRDIHPAAAPPWWPPAPGWWIVAGVLLLLVALALAWWWRRRLRRRRLLALFDAATAVDDPSAVVAAVSSLLRRAARRVDPAADRLGGEAWLAFLDAGNRVRRFDGARGALLLDGAFRPGVSPEAAADLRQAAREQFAEWMARS